MVQLAWGKTLANSLHQRTLRLSMTPGLLMGETSLENLELKWRIAWGAHRGLDPRARKAQRPRHPTTPFFDAKACIGAETSAGSTTCAAATERVIVE